MLTLARIAVVAMTFCFMAGKQAQAACVHFEETRSGDAYLVNSCATDMNAAYAVTSGGDWQPGSSTLARVLVPAEDRKLLWADGNRPVAGRYKIKVFACVAPTSLVYTQGSRPTCQIGFFADAG